MHIHVQYCDKKLMVILSTISSCFSSLQFSSVQSLSHAQLFATLWTAAPRPPCPSPTPRVYSNSSPLSW